MPQITKPNTLNKIWADGGDKATPLDSKINSGWQIEIPPRQWFNWLDNRQDQAIAHINQHGIAVWDNVTEYQANKSYVQDPSNGVVYRCLATNAGNLPSTSPTFWAVAFADAADAFSEGAADAKYLAKGQNLADIPNKNAARNNLSVYSRAEADTAFATNQFFAANRSLSVNGYQRLPGTNGLIIQWGESSGRIGGYNTTHTTPFPIAFPNGVLNVLVSSRSDRNTNPLSNRFAYLITNTNTNFTWGSDAVESSSFPIDVVFIAIGY